MPGAAKDRGLSADREALRRLDPEEGGVRTDGEMEDIEKVK